METKPQRPTDRIQESNMVDKLIRLTKEVLTAEYRDDVDLMANRIMTLRIVMVSKARELFAERMKKEGRKVRIFTVTYC